MNAEQVRPQNVSRSPYSAHNGLRKDVCIADAHRGRSRGPRVPPTIDSSKERRRVYRCAAMSSTRTKSTEFMA